MKNKDILDKIKSLSNEEKRNLDYNKLVNIINVLSPDEIISLSNIIGYPVFTRLCMGYEHGNNGYKIILFNC